MPPASFNSSCVPCSATRPLSSTTMRSQRLRVVIADECAARLDAADLAILREVLSLDPRPRYHHDDQREYGMPFRGFNVRFRVVGSVVQVISIAR